ncbi:MAG: Histone-fold containing [Lasallia pustulata]|uniref:Histone-fold containing n=1 Tax=Lasallia pustulata TaxID=136370 RepID=A0A5M8PK37_9LECA|nr:MAG: Histone-fold containing [Lasallia pustulata]
MAAAPKLYPRSTIKRIIKAHSKRPLSKNVDVLIFLDYTLFLHHLIREASIQAKQSGDKNITARAVRKVTEESLRKFKG